ncbi:MAG: SDR family NAD(P)-dependent oxidoreductase [Burkholderiales bacterium]|jgi:NAD(P)-dependent dehydrogenase (short-subunit alcohol dehydrogenase family)|nr:SDR family NAD(P)-dependent oxidoreductase [Burkholderiales bacterium]
MSDGNRLSGRHALVTGAAGGIGAAIAGALARDGAAVTLAGRRKDALEQLRMALPNPALHGVAVFDVTAEDAVSRAFTESEVARGPVDILIANAGAAPSAPFGRTDRALWDSTLALNLTGVFHCLKAAVPGMQQRGRGRIVAVASTAGLVGYPYVSAYVAAKHGVVGLVRALALELATSGVTVNAVCPGFTDTPLIAGAVDTIVAKTGRTAVDARRTLARSNPQGRLVTPEEVADAVLWLAGDGASAVTGQAIAVAGGEVMAG